MKQVRSSMNVIAMVCGLVSLISLVAGFMHGQPATERTAICVACIGALAVISVLYLNPYPRLKLRWVDMVLPLLLSTLDVYMLRAMFLYQDLHTQKLLLCGILVLVLPAVVALFALYGIGKAKSVYQQ